MPSAPVSFAAKSPLPVYALALPRSDVLLYTGGGGNSKSGVGNAIRSVTLSATGLEENAEVKLSSDEDAPMCMSVSPANAKEEDPLAPIHRKVVVGVNSAIRSDGENENIRMFEWSSARSEQKKDEHEIQSVLQAESVAIKDPEEYVKRLVVSPNGKLLAVGGTDGQMALHSFPSLKRLWIVAPEASTGSKTSGIVDATFSADSALIAFVAPSAILIYPTAQSTASSLPELYQSIKNPSLGASGCVFRAARFGRNGRGADDITCSRLYTVVNTNPPAGLGTSKKDRERAKIRRCFVSIWDADRWTLLQTRQISERPATVAELSDTGTHLAVSTSDLSIHCLSARSLRTVWQLRDAHAFPGTCLAFSPDGDVLASGSADMSLRIAKVGEGREPVAAVALLEGRFVTLLLAVMLAFIAWRFQHFFIRVVGTGVVGTPLEV